MYMFLDIIWPISQITLLCIKLIFLKMKFIYYYSPAMFAMKFMSICNDYVNYDKFITQ